MKKKGQLKPTLPLIEQQLQEEDFEQHNNQQPLKFAKSQHVTMQFMQNQQKANETQIRSYRKYDDDDQDDDVDSNLSTLPDITTPAGRMQTLQTSEAAQYYSYTQKQRNNTSCSSLSNSHFVGRLSPKLINYQDQTRVQREINNQNQSSLGEDRQSFTANQILTIIAFVTICLGLFFVIMMCFSSSSSPFAIDQNSNLDKKMNGKNLNLASSVKMNCGGDYYNSNCQYIQVKKNQGNNKGKQKQYKIFDGLSLIKRLISKLIEPSAGGDVVIDSDKKDSGGEDDDVGSDIHLDLDEKENVYGSKNIGSVLAPFYSVTATSSENEVSQILHKQTKEKILNQDELNSQYTTLIYFFIFVMFPLYCNAFYLYRKMILVAAILRQRKMQEEMMKLQQNASLIKNDNQRAVQGQNVRINYDRVKIQKKGEKSSPISGATSKSCGRQSLSKERSDYIQTMQHIEREANIGKILLTKTEDAAKRVKVMNLGKKVQRVNNKDNKINSSTDARIPVVANRSQSFSVLVGFANFISLAQTQVYLSLTIKPIQ